MTTALRNAGIPSRVDAGNLIADDQEWPLWKVLSCRPESVVDLVVMQLRPTLLLDLATEVFAGDSVRLTAAEWGLVVQDRDRQAEFRPTSARIPSAVGGLHPRVVNGDFYSGLAAWESARAEFLAGRRPAPKRQAPQNSEKLKRDASISVMTHPELVGRTQRETMAVDSHRLRTLRTTAVGVPVVLQIKRPGETPARLTLHPVRTGGTFGTAQEIPVTFDAPPKRLEGALRLTTPRTAPTLAFVVFASARCGPLTTTTVWSLALRAAADLLCEEEEETPNATPNATRRPARGASRSTPRPHAHRNPHSTPATLVVPSDWQPTEATKGLMVSAVKGFRRRIAGPASDTARANAARHAITLPQRGMTWVEPFIRGTADAAALQLVFNWRPPDELLVGVRAPSVSPPKQVKIRRPSP